MTLYIDIVLLENIIMNYIIILATGMICKISIKKSKVFLSSLLGALYAILIYSVDLEIYINSIIKILISVCMIYIAFNSNNINIMLKQLLIFYLTSFCFGGVSYYLLCNINNNDLRGVYTIKVILLGGFLGFLLIISSFKKS